MNIQERFEHISKGNRNYSIPCIYKITNIRNGNFYVGQTTSFYERMSDHIASMIGKQYDRLNLNRSRYYTNNSFTSLRSTKIKKPIVTVNKLEVEYGLYNMTDFVMDIIEECSPHILLEREHFWIKELKAGESLNGRSSMPKQKSVTVSGGIYVN